MVHKEKGKISLPALNAELHSDLWGYVSETE